MTLTFEFTVSSGHEVEIAWYRSGTLIIDGTFSGVIVTGATTNTMTITNPTADWDGSYYAVVSDLTAGCETTTDELPIVIPGLCRMEITTQPASQEVEDGGTLTLSVVGTGNAGPITYQWYKDGVELTDGGNISGSTSDTLIITGVASSDAGSYTVALTDSGIADCSVESDAAVVTVAGALSFCFFMSPIAEPDPAGSGILADYSFELWDDPSGDVQAAVRLTCSAVGGGSGNYEFGLTVEQGGDSNSFSGEVVAMPIRTWHHVAVVYNSNTGYASLYVDASLIATTAGTPVIFNSQPYGVVLMDSDAVNFTDYLDSYVFLQDLTGYWIGHALTQAEITALYAGGSGLNGPPWGSITEPTVWWDFDDADRVTAQESFFDTILGVELFSFDAQIEGLSNWAAIRTPLSTTLATDPLASLAYTT